MTAIQFISFGRRMTNIYNDFFLPLCSKYDMNSTCMDILLFLANNPEYSTARDLRSLRGIKSGNASVAVEALIKGGYLKRTDDATDRRVKHLTPTEKASPVVADGRKMQKYFMKLMQAGFTDEEFNSLKSAENKLRANLERLEKNKSTELTGLSDK